MSVSPAGTGAERRSRVLASSAPFQLAERQPASAVSAP